MKKLRILLADDHQIVRDSLRLLLDGQPGIQVVGVAADGEEVLLRVRELDPDVVVMDLSMPRMNGVEATQRLKAERPAIKIIALTAHDDESYLTELCRAGASGYVLKHSPAEQLIAAIHLVAKGEAFFEPALAAKVLARQVAHSRPSPDPEGIDLSAREKEVLVRVAGGYSNKEIARALELSVKTVETYKTRVACKLGLRSRTQIVQFALRQGWLKPEVRD